MLVALIAGNRLAPVWLEHQEEARAKPRVSVRGEQPGGKHTTIGIDETSLKLMNSPLLRFSTLAEWNFDPDDPPPCPEQIQKRHGTAASIVGFMYPLASGDKLSLFCLCRTTQTCCYGPRPEYSQYLFVEMDEPIDFIRIKPVQIDGTFYVDPQPQDGYIYRLEGETARVIEDDMPDIDPVIAARETGKTLFDFNFLERMGSDSGDGGDPEVSAEIRALDGKTIVVAGYQVGSVGEDGPIVFVGKEWWDGMARGTPPNLFNAMMVFPKNPGEMPPAWKQKVVFTGRVRVAADSSEFSENGILSLRDAVRGVPGWKTGMIDLGRGDGLVPLWAEALGVIVFLVIGSIVFLFVGRRGEAE